MSATPPESTGPDAPAKDYVRRMGLYLAVARMAVGRRVLDLGCGDGRGSDLLAGIAAHVTGVHSETDHLAKAQARYGRDGVTFVKGTATALPAPDASVDVVVAIDTDTGAAMAEIRRVLVPGGVLVTSVLEDPTAAAGPLLPGFEHARVVQGPDAFVVASDDPAQVDGWTVAGDDTNRQLKAALAAEQEYLGLLSVISAGISALQRANPISNAGLVNLILRLIQSRVLYGLSNGKRFSERRRKRFRKSAEKRDPMRLAQKVDDFCVSYLREAVASKALQERSLDRMTDLGMTVTAIVPNYNHARFLEKRLDSILDQTYPLIDLVILDDCSTDNSREIIADYAERFPDRVTVHLNDTNSGSVFRQWQKGLDLASGDFVWLCESDDFCEPDFVQNLISAFRDPSVMLAFGKIEFADEKGKFYPGLENFRERAEAGIWSRPLVRPAARWFKGGFGVQNVIANVGGSIWRRVPLPESDWDMARRFKVMGDWYLYSRIAQGGQIAYQPRSVAYFRQHGRNTSGHLAQATPAYYEEYARLMTALKTQWDIPDKTVDRFVAHCREIFDHGRVRGARFEALIDADALKAVEPAFPHVLIGILGFSYGGGEILPIHLANALHDLGVKVSMLQMMDSDDQPGVREMLSPAVPVYTANTLRDMGVRRFMDEAGIDIVHSHIASVDGFLLEQGRLGLPYLVTLHGSYEAVKVPTARLRKWAREIDGFVYLADRNLTPFEGLDIDRTKFRKMRNAMPVSPRAFGQTRADLGIPEDAVVFTLVARGIPGKGWVEAVRAFQTLRAARPDRPMALLLAGEGPETARAQAVAGADTDIRFLGFAREIHGLYRISDVALVPTRYAGESFPLCIIEAMQVGVPVIATEIGEVPTVILTDDLRAGLIVPNLNDDEAYVAAVAERMAEMMDAVTRKARADDAAALGESFAMDALARDYLGLYRDIIARKA